MSSEARRRATFPSNTNSGRSCRRYGHTYTITMDSINQKERKEEEEDELSRILVFLIAEARRVGYIRIVYNMAKRYANVLTFA